MSSENRSHTRLLTFAVAEIAVATPVVDTAKATSKENTTRERRPSEIIQLLGEHRVRCVRICANLLGNLPLRLAYTKQTHGGIAGVRALGRLGTSVGFCRAGDRCAGRLKETSHAAGDPCDGIDWIHNGLSDGGTGLLGRRGRRLRENAGFTQLT